MCACVCVCQSVCGWTDWLSYGQTLFMVGLLLGSLVGGALSDRYNTHNTHCSVTYASLMRHCSPVLFIWCVCVCVCRYGKRPVLLVCVFVHAVCGVVPAVLSQPFLFLAVRCLTGVCCCCINICSFSLGNKTLKHDTTDWKLTQKIFKNGPILTVSSSVWLSAVWWVLSGHSWTLVDKEHVCQIKSCWPGWVLMKQHSLLQLPDLWPLLSSALRTKRLQVQYRQRVFLLWELQ